MPKIGIKMTYQEVIEQSKTFTIQQRRDLAYFLLYPTLQKKEKTLFDNFFDVKIDLEKLKENKQKNISDKKTRKEGFLKEKPVFGCMKGMVEYMADDFDAPLDDLVDYMY